MLKLGLVLIKPTFRVGEPNVRLSPQQRRESRWGGWLPLPPSQRQGGAVTQHELGAATMEITTVGLNLAKDVFKVHAIGSTGGVVVRRSLGRAQVVSASSRRVSLALRRGACSQQSLRLLQRQQHTRKRDHEMGTSHKLLGFALAGVLAAATPALAGKRDQSVKFAYDQAPENVDP